MQVAELRQGGVDEVHYKYLLTRIARLILSGYQVQRSKDERVALLIKNKLITRLYA